MAKRYDWSPHRPPLGIDTVQDFARDGRRLGVCWTFKSPVTMRSIKVGACKNPTPAELWGARKRRRR